MVKFTSQPFQYLIASALVLLSASAAPAQTGAVQNVHDPAIIQEGNAFYLFCTGNGVPIRKSTDLLNWQLAGTALSESPPWRGAEFPGRSIWAPDISKFGGTFHLYFAVSTFGKNRSIIGLATTKTLDSTSADYHWTDQGKVIETTTSDNWNAIDPNIVLDEHDQPWLVMGSFWSGIKMRRIDAETGLLSEADTKLYSLASRTERPRAVEAPFMIRHGEHFYLFVSFDQCCRGVNSTYKIMVGRANAITGPFADRENHSMMEGGATLVLESQASVRGPGHCAVLTSNDKQWLVHHFYDADNRGRPTLQIRPLTWDDQDWPVAGKPIDAPIGDAK